MCVLFLFFLLFAKNNETCLKFIVLLDQFCFVSSFFVSCLSRCVNRVGGVTMFMVFVCCLCCVSFNTFVCTLLLLWVSVCVCVSGCACVCVCVCLCVSVSVSVCVSVCVVLVCLWVCRACGVFCVLHVCVVCLPGVLRECLCFHIGLILRVMCSCVCGFVGRLGRVVVGVGVCVSVFPSFSRDFSSIFMFRVFRHFCRACFCVFCIVFVRF